MIDVDGRNTRMLYVLHTGQQDIVRGDIHRIGEADWRLKYKASLAVRL